MTHGQSRLRVCTLTDAAHPVAIHVAHFPGRDGADEFHLMLRPTAYADIATQGNWLHDAYRQALATLGLEADSALLQRVFCSDLSNQAALLAGAGNPPADCAVSWVGQPPLPPAKIARWAYHVRLPDGPLLKRREGASLAWQRGELTHRWTTGLTCAGAFTSEEQTRGIFTEYERGLRAGGLTLADHVLRTWFFVRDIDANYRGLVEARKAFFATRGLTPDTHYIASTGIAGAAAEVAAGVMMDAYALAGVRPAQIRYLTAPDHLCPTHRYGVTFERGVAVDYRDRTHVMISGTASIDADGEIVHPGDVGRQLDRTLENIDALLRHAGAARKDIAMALVYVRDPSDLAIVQHLMTEHYGDIPHQLLLAPVCRPGWLVEVECEAITPADNPTLPAF